MILTETEARKKLCPMSRNAYPMPDVSDTLCYCGASQCMAWRWVPRDVYEDKDGSHPIGEPHGYCGMAGNRGAP